MEKVKENQEELELPTANVVILKKKGPPQEYALPIPIAPDPVLPQEDGARLAHADNHRPLGNYILIQKHDVSDFAVKTLSDILFKPLELGTLVGRVISWGSECKESTMKAIDKGDLVLYRDMTGQFTKFNGAVHVFIYEIDLISVVKKNAKYDNWEMNTLL